MPLTRRQRADMNSRYDGWNPEEEAYYISKLVRAARRDHVQDLEDLRLTLERIAVKMNERFHRRFHLTLLKLKLERIRREYVDFKEFLDQPGIQYDPYSCRTSVSNEYWTVISPHHEPGNYRRYRTEGHRHYR